MTAPGDRPPSMKAMYALTDAFDALAKPRRLLIFNALVTALVKGGRPVGFKELQQQLGIPPASLSRILHRFEVAKLVTLTTHADRTMSVAVDVRTLAHVTSYLLSAHSRLVPPPPKDGDGPANSADAAQG